jgi:GrpB-like predicted nucleotidyltransferase (UPF0157 family)
MKKIREIAIVAYRLEWVEEFAAIAIGLREALGPLALRIDHIGSTAVPGLAAKDDIDVQVTVRELTGELEPAFARAGYQRWTDITHDHRPPTANEPEREWEKQYYQSEGEGRRIRIHARRAGSPNGRYALLFRDYLRAHQLAAAAYAQVKTALARYAPMDWDLYYDVKDPVCDIVMAGAEDWAAVSGWRAEHYS